ncbi:Flp family type IVb pilin [Qipengyuania gaetbuli]|uniref:Flp family type IVb pilin n=1 Tax=Qipengyuania gaetbuli TaxID=266952 RepID=A0A844Y0B8_9SPHN|nr:Flp family type IVb pilin [Qipengyuania gaetbuli]MBY6013353.1 Flp family type IVb pilin [Qipengyuania gaetbuli]MCA0909069.1 Flp family type IVb pilin [Qipengyuania gaetbuli]MXO50793.1 Flp family type IVb pilin [Qipengyuania gaetbuli]
MIEFLKNLGRDDSGATAIEYGLILALIFLGMMTAVTGVGQTTINMWNNVSTTVATVTGV